MLIFEVDNYMKKCEDHIERMETTRTPKLFMEYKPVGKRGS
jgi:hypothetical protein